MKKSIRILITITTCLLVGFLSSKFTVENIPTWYNSLRKPFFNPPNWVFMPVWTTLYILMGYAAGVVWSFLEEKGKNVQTALYFFIIQLALNGLWSYLFFELKNMLLALIEMALLWLLIYETYLKFKKIHSFSAKLLLPYLAWVSFAFLLNLSVWWLNK